MTLIDFIIGATLMNAMPHFVLGTWSGRILSAFGFGDLSNKLYGLLNFSVSGGLFLYAYGFEGIIENGIYAGAMSILLIYFVSGHLWRNWFVKNTQPN